MALVNWSFVPLVPSFPLTVLPNVGLWNASNNLGLEYQIQISWPYEWSSRDVNNSALILYLLDGNALGGTAVEAFHRRKWIEPSQPDSITVSIGYPLTDTAYSPQRNIDFQPPTLDGQPPATFPVQGAQPGGEEFLFFIESILRPWVRSTVFPNVHFKRDGLYGHSLGGMFTSWVLLSRPDLFDTFIVGSPALLWNNNALISNYSTYLNTTYQSTNSTKPALKVTYGSLEADPVKRRTETDEEFETRKEFYASFSVGHNAEAFYGLVDASVVRNKEFQLYPGSDHSSTAASTLADGIDYFLDW